MGESTREHLKELLESFDTAILITRHGEKDHARPMAIAGVEGANTVWFVTSRSSPKTEELRKDSYVALTFQSSRRFVVLSGRGAIVDDRAKLTELWKPGFTVWFPNGKDDPDATLIRVTVTDAEFWDSAGAKGIRYAFEAAKSLLTKEPPEELPGQHGRVTSGANGEPLSKPH